MQTKTTEYKCPVCDKPGYMYCIHMQTEANKRWLHREQEIKLAYDNLANAISLYYAMTGDKPYVVTIP
jgi:hypothetical protein